MKRLFGYSKGQMFVLYLAAVPALLGAIALSTDVGIMYFNWASMQRAVDAAALAGANYLPEDTSTAAARATLFATLNGLASTEVATTFNDPTDDTITVTASRDVPYYVAKVVGLTSQLVQVTASAQAPGGGISCLDCASLGPMGQPPLASGGTITPSTPGSSLGEYQVLPMALDKSVLYKGCGTSVVLQQGRVSPGNWDFLELGGPGGNVLRNNIANGYTGPILAGQFIWTKSGQNVGPANQGFDDRIGATSAGTWQSHSQSDPRVVLMPIVDWSLVGNGSSTIEVLGFAHMYLAQNLGHGQFQAYYIDDVVPDSLASATPPPAGFRGARGNPVLIR